MMRTLGLLACLLLLGGCAAHHTLPPPARTVDGGQKATWHQMETTTHDGQRLAFTVYQPALAPGQTAPLILHTHGFGLWRMSNPHLGLYPNLLDSGKMARRAWREGYWVISWDSRGSGDTGGHIRVADPDYEIRDIRTLIDWAEANLPQLARQEGDPLIGMVGESLGGGQQYLASAMDKRIDAIVPLTTWFDLETALAPNGVPKDGWLWLLNFAADWLNFRKFDPEVRKAYVASTRGQLPASTYDLLNRHRLRWFCDQGQPPQADALIVQGFRDVLFPFNQALEARQCLLDAGRDVRLIGQDGGHLLPTAQHSPGFNIPGFYLEKEVHCGGHTLALDDTVQNWLDGKLRGQAERLETVPRFCIDDAPVQDVAALQPTQTWPLPTLTLAAGGRFEWLMKPLDHVGNWFVPTRLPADWQQPSSGSLRPARLPLTVVEQDAWLVGIPRLRLQLQDPADASPTLYVHLAAWRPGSGSYRVLSEQVMPFSNTRQQARIQAAREAGLAAEVDAKLAAEADGVALPAVRARLKKGEVLGLVVTSYSNQFSRSGRWHAEAGIAGEIDLPAFLPQ